MNYKNKIVQDDLKNILAQDYIDWNRLFGKTILITGANGMLATYMVYTLAYLNDIKGANVHIVVTSRNMVKSKDRFSALLSKKYFELIEYDVTNPFDYNGEIDYIIHAASNASPKFITSDPVGIINANVNGTINLLEFAKNKKITNFLFLSTREIYGKSDSKMVTENSYGGFDILSSRACYPESKRMAETILASYYEQYRIPFTIARIAHSYGPGMTFFDDGRIMSDLLANVINEESIILKSDGTAERAFCYLSDAVSALFLILLQGEIKEAYNVCNEDEPIKIKNLANLLVKLFPNKNLKVIFDIPKTHNGAYSKMGRTYMSTAKIEKLGWKRQVSLSDGILKTIESVEEDHG